mgnify:CR=1 FL=1
MMMIDLTEVTLKGSIVVVICHLEITKRILGMVLRIVAIDLVEVIVIEGEVEVEEWMIGGLLMTSVEEEMTE